MWDLFVLVWVMDYLCDTADVLLIKQFVGIMRECRSVKSHMLRTCCGSGAIYTNVRTIKIAVKSIFKSELLACSDGIDTMLYANNVLEELGYLSKGSKEVATDNSATMHWIRGSVSNSRSRHIDTRIYNARHHERDGNVRVKYVPTDENTADILTKPLSCKLFVKHARAIQG